MTNWIDHTVKIIEFRQGQILYRQNQGRAVHVLVKKKKKIEKKKFPYDPLENR